MYIIKWVEGDQYPVSIDDVPAMDENEKKGEEDPDNEFVMFDNDSGEEGEYDDRYAVYSFFHDLQKVF